MTQPAPGEVAERRNYLLPDEPRWPRDPERPVIELRGVSKSFGGLRVIDRLDLAIHTGLTTVICGQSGSGKSVLVKLMNGLLAPDEGQVLLFGEDVRQVSDERLVQLRKRVTMLFQSYALMDSLSVTANIAFPIYENTTMRWAAIVPLVRELLELLDLRDAGDKMVSELSGGMKKRVSLARAVISNPEVVLFDEPTTGLDPVMTEFVDDMIERTRDRFGITSVIVSHNMTETLRLADRVAMLAEGRVARFGTLDEVLASGHPLVDVFFEGAGERLQVEGAGERPRAQELGGGSPADDTSGSQRRDTAPWLQVTGEPHVAPGESAAGGSSEPTSGDPDGPDPPIVQVVDVYKSFGRHEVLKGVSLDIPRGRITVIIGGSGSGKSVIMKHIIGIFKADRGEVRVFGRDITPLADVELLPVRARFGMLFQGAALLDSMTVWDNVAFPLLERRHPRRAVHERVAEILEQLELADLGSRYPSDISNGQRKRVGLARAIATKPEIMIYDEPTTGQDPVMTRYVDDMIVEAQELFDITSLVVSHDMLSTFRIGHQIALLHFGQIQMCGTADELKASPDPYVRRFIYAGTPEGERARVELEGA